MLGDLGPALLQASVFIAIINIIVITSQAGTGGSAHPFH